MIPDIENILYATDLSENARHSFGYAASLSDRYGAGITILHVLEDLSPSTIMQVKSIMGEEWWLEAMERNKEDIIAGIRKRLEEFCDKIGSQHATCAFKVADILIAEGQAVATILETAADIRSDLIVMGTHGYGSFKEALMGSTARRVVRRSPVPVLTVRQPKKRA
jgi:nucleotide-binding universal stress UspA family protein